MGWLGSNEVSPQVAAFWGKLCLCALNPSHPLVRTGFETASSHSPFVI